MKRSSVYTEPHVHARVHTYPHLVDKNLEELTYTELALRRCGDRKNIFDFCLHTV